MATRFYLPISGASGILPAVSTSWYGAASSGLGQGLLMVTTRINTVITEKTHADSDSSDRHFYFGQWVSARLQPQSLPQQTFTIAVRNNETDAKNNMQMHFIIRILAADNTTYQDVVSFTDEGSERGTTAGVSFWTGNTTARTLVGGDRLVAEIGLGGDPTTTAVHNGSMWFGDNNANDNVGTDGDTNNYNPWINFGTTTLAFMRRRIWTIYG